MDNLGYLGVAVLMFAENIFPPIPSEVVMPAAGFAAQRGERSFWAVVAAGSVGSLAGALPWYFIARQVGSERLRGWVAKYGAWLAVRPEEIDRVDQWFDRWGGWAVLIGRLVPGVRTLISVPAGFAEMPFTTFLTYSAIGTAAWTLLLGGLGWWLEDQRELVDTYVGYVALGVFLAIGGWYLYRLARFHGWLS
jgi:membrane protein DedA with SNARE-associated domain